MAEVEHLYLEWSPVEPNDLDMIAQQTPGISTKDKDRVAVFNYLTLEMNFFPDWVKQLENHYTTFLYDNVNTLYLAVDDLYKSGANQIWQESPILREDGPVQTREFRHLEVRQFRARIKAMESYASKVRFDFNTNPAHNGAKVRTRIVEHKDPSKYEYVLQHKFSDSSSGPVRYYTTPWPENNDFPDIQWNITSYIQFDIAKMKPTRDRSARKSVK